jgi:hypothetical protein
MALLNIAMMDAAISCWDAKYTYFNPRPSSRSFDKTTTGVPNFPVRFWTFHFSAAASQVLSHIIPSKDHLRSNGNRSLYLDCMEVHYRGDCGGQLWAKK